MRWVFRCMRTDRCSSCAPAPAPAPALAAGKEVAVIGPMVKAAAVLVGDIAIDSRAAWARWRKGVRNAARNRTRRPCLRLGECICPRCRQFYRLVPASLDSLVSVITVICELSLSQCGRALTSSAVARVMPVGSALCPAIRLGQAVMRSGGMFDARLWPTWRSS